jgi:probable addiction module antidote protein
VEEEQMTKSRPYDSAEFLDTPEAVQFYMEEALESDDPSLIAHALGVVARAKSMSDVARKSGLSRESLYRSLSATGKPEIGTVIRVLNALDLKLSVGPRTTKKKAARRKKDAASRRRMGGASPSAEAPRARTRAIPII